MKKITLNIKGMHCFSCSKLIEGELEDNKISSKIDPTSGKAIINFDEKKISQKKIIELITKAGYGVKL